MEAFPSRRFGGADPPPPPPPPHSSASWYPPPPLVAASSSPHHLPPYSHVPYPPHPQHHQWPPPDRHHLPPQPPHLPAPYPVYAPPPYHGAQVPFPPYGAPSHNYTSPSPPPLSNLQRPHHAALPLPQLPLPPPSAYPPPNQAWANPSWIQNQGWEYPDRSIPYNNEDWAAKAKAWAAAAEIVTEPHQTQPYNMLTGRAEDRSYAYHEQYQAPFGPQTEALDPSLPQPDVCSSYVAGGEVNTADKAQLASPQRNFSALPPIYEQEVPYSYSSAPGNRDAMFKYESSQLRPSSARSSIQDGHLYPIVAPPSKCPSVEQRHLDFGGQPSALTTDVSNRPLDFSHRSSSDIERHQAITYGHGVPVGPVGVVDHDVIATSAHSWAPSGAAGYVPQSSFPPAVQVSASVHPAPLFGSVPGANYRPNAPASHEIGTVTSLLHTEAFPGDVNGSLNLAERPKKTAVPNWLREEILKSKSVLASASTHHAGNAFTSAGSEDAENSFKKIDQADSKSIDSSKSTEDEEDEVEAARTTAINQEIKRVLTEVLLKVTDDLFDEIAIKVLNEDDPAVGVSESKHLVDKVAETTVLMPMTSSMIPDPGKTDINKVGIPSDESVPSSPKGDILGLANYASDDDGNEDGARWSSLTSHDTKTIASHQHESDTKAVTSHQQESKDSSSQNALKAQDKHSFLLSKEESSGLSNVESERNRKAADLGTRNLSKKNFNPNSLVENALTSDNHSLNLEKLQKMRHDNFEGQTSADEQQNTKLTSNASVAYQKKQKDGRTDDKSLEFTGWTAKEGSLSIGEADGGDLKGTLSRNIHTEEAKDEEDSVRMVKAGPDRTGCEILNADNHNNRDVMDILKGRIEKKDDFPDKVFDRSARKGEGPKDSNSRGNTKQHDAKDDRSVAATDKRQRTREDIDRKRVQIDVKPDRSRQFSKDSVNHNSKRSPSPRGRSQTSKENSLHGHGGVSSDEPSENSKRRKMQAFTKSSSPSHTKPKNRQVSRSPHSKHSHRRHSPYSSVERRRRSRSITPVKRRKH